MRSSISLTALTLAAAILAGCSSAPKAGSGLPGDPGPQGKPEAPFMVGPDVVAELPAGEAWAVLVAADKWGEWNPKALSPSAALPLSPGAEIGWTWGGKQVASKVEAVNEGASLWLRGAAAGGAVGLRWTLSALSPERCSVSLKAALKPGSPDELVAAAISETTDWIMAFKAELDRRAAAKPKALPKKKAKK